MFAPYAVNITSCEKGKYTGPLCSKYWFPQVKQPIGYQSESEISRDVHAWRESDWRKPEHGLCRIRIRMGHNTFPYM